MKLNKSTFWEYDIAKMNPEEDFYTIIPRIAMRGTYNEWLAMKKFYGDTRIKQVLKEERFLDKKTLHYFSILYNIPKEEFRCYTMKQLDPTPWDY